MTSLRRAIPVRAGRRRLPLFGAVLLVSGYLGCSGWSIQKFDSREANEWAMAGHDSRRTWNAGQEIRPPLELAWKFDASAATGSPAIVDSILFVGNYKNELLAVRITDGHRIGRITLEGAIYATPLIDRSVLYIALAAGENTFQALDAIGGEVLWQKHLGPIETSPVLYDKKLFIAGVEGTVYCLDEDTGTEQWHYQLPESKKGSRIHSSPATDGTVVVFGNDDGKVYALDAASGKPRWTYQTGASIFGSPAMGMNSIVIGSTDQVLYSLSTTDGSLMWKSDFGGSIYSSPAIEGNTVVIGAANGCLRALSLDSGKIMWEHTTPSVVDAPALICGGTAYVGGLDRRFYAFNLENGGIVWSDSVEGRIKQPPAASEGMIFVPVEDKYIYAYRIQR